MSPLPVTTVVLTVAVTALVSTLYSRSGPWRAEQPVTTTTASVPQLMAGLIEPHADAVFSAASYIVNATGARTIGPSSADEWMAVERSASVLIDAAALLNVPGRESRWGRLVAVDWARWRRYAAALGETAAWARDAARARSADRLLATGGDISLACEQCHLAFRYPEGRQYLPPEP